MNNPATDIKPMAYERLADGRIKTTFSNGAELTVNGKYYGLMRDAGQVTAFQPALYVKPQGPIQRLQSAWSAFLGKPTDRSTTEQGASSAASPVNFYLTLWSQLFGRRARIEDTRLLYLSDPRVFASANMYVDVALKGGPKIIVQGKNRRDKRAQEIAKKVQRIYNASLVQEWGKGLIIEGDLFVQHCVDPETHELFKAVAMPGVGMQRLVNDADQFMSEERAFEQVDSMTFEHVAYFPSSLMTHTRWSKINGDQYGTSELVTARRLIRAIELCEQALTISRMVRAPLRRLHNVGTPENTSSAQELLNYKAENGFFTGKNEAYNPQSVMIDYYANGNVKIDTLIGDPNQAQVDDIRYMSEVLFCALPTPGAFFGFGIREAKRDVLEDMKRLWILKHSKLQDAINEPVAHGFELALVLAGIDPSLIDYSITWGGGTLDTITETVDWLATAKAAKIISQRTAVSVLAQRMGDMDFESELSEIERDNESAKPEMEEPPIPPDSLNAHARRESPANTKNGQLKSKPPAESKN